METNKRNQLITENMRLVEKLAKMKKKSISSPQVFYEDLLSAGFLGLVEASDKYDEKKGSFETWASQRITGSMSDYIHELFRWVKWMPEGSKASSLDNLELVYYDKNDVEDCFEQLTQNLPQKGKDILRWYYMDGLTLEQIGDNLGVGKARMSQLLKKYKRMLKKA